MSAPLSGKSLQRNERLSLGDGIAFSLMVGFGESFIPAFILTLGHSESASGIISSVPLLAGAVFQLVSLWLCSCLKSYKRSVLLCATLQVISLIPFCIAGLGYPFTFTQLLLFASIYWAGAMAAGPSWNAWMGHLIPTEKRTSFWTMRTRLAQGGSLLGFLVGGVILENVFPRTQAFGILIAIAILGRLTSMVCLSLQTEAQSFPDKENTLPFSGTKFLTQNASVHKMVKYVLFLHFGAYIAAPYFTPFMLSELRLSHMEFVLLTGMSCIAKMIMLPLLAHYANRIGTTKVLRFAGIGIFTLPVLWLVDHNFYYLLFLQFLSGFYWAAIDLLFPLYILEAVPAESRLSVFGTYNSWRALLIVVGSLIGAQILEAHDNHYMGYVVAFSLSTCFRATSVLWLWKIKLPKLSKFISFRTTGLRPSVGTVVSPVIGFFFPKTRKKPSSTEEETPKKQSSVG